MSFLSDIKQRATQIKSQAQVLLIAYKHKRTPASAKILIAITVGYLLCPIDLIPDFIPVLGLLDDVIIVPALIVLSINLIPNDVLNEAREFVRSNPQELKKTNWIFALVIIGIWMIVLYYTFLSVRRRWI